MEVTAIPKIAARLGFLFSRFFCFRPLTFFGMGAAVISRVKPHDCSIREAVRWVLHETGYAPLRKIQCDVLDGVVELTGSVPSFYVKQLAQTAVLRIEQIRGIKNLLRVA
jgi:BON domain